MKNLKEDYYNPFFSHIYVEKDVLEHYRTQRILAQFASSSVILVDHYKDVFCRSRQQYVLQHRSQNLIIAQKQPPFLYEGAPVCQNFGNDWFYYTSCMMNCVYDCEYCYLKGMYPSANVVLFVNLEDTFSGLEKMLAQHPVYLCASYDTDLMAMEGIAGYVKAWNDFAAAHPRLTIELRTKSANLPLIERMPVLSNVIYAFTLSPQAVIDAYEHGTPALYQRIACAAAVVQKGYPVRLCFDPMIYCPDWEKHYSDMLKQVYEQVNMAKIMDVSVGSFRVSQEYLKKMRKNEPGSAVVQFPYENDGGVYHYPAELTKRMENSLAGQLSMVLAPEKIFFWETQEENEEPAKNESAGRNI